MPTIDQLATAIVAADDDAFFVSQGGSTRRMTRGQLLAGLQAKLSLLPGLLGRTTAGVGAPEHISIGGGLRLAGGVLSSAPGFTVAALPTTNRASAVDLVPISQGGQDRAVAISALLSVRGADISGQIVAPSLGIARPLSDWATDEMAVEAFGAIGDGTSNDTAAFDRAIASGRPIKLGPKTYRIDGQWTISSSAVLAGTPGVSRILRTTQRDGAWISVSGPTFRAVGIIFDGGLVTTRSWGVLVLPQCSETTFDHCKFINSSGGDLGNGLTIQARDGLTGTGSRHTIRQCCFSNNANHGLWIQAACAATVQSCQAWANRGYGICLDFNDSLFQQVVRNCSVIASQCWNNRRGISVGNYNETNQEPARWGLSNPDARNVLVVANTCFDNTEYGIAAAGDGISVRDNDISVDGIGLASGILLNAVASSVIGNKVQGAGQFGIDAGGCSDVIVAANSVRAFAVGINVGGSVRMRVDGNTLLGNTRAVTVFQVETDGLGGNFGLRCSIIAIGSNTISIAGNESGGIYLFDDPDLVSILDNSFVADTGVAPSQAIRAQSGSVEIRGNTWNGTRRGLVAADDHWTAGTLTVPEIFDEAVLPAPGSTIDRIVGSHQDQVADIVTFVRVTNPGQGYTTATVLIAGAGAGAQGSAYIRDGAIIGVAMSSGGSGYRGSPVNVTIVGDGRDATAIGSVGLPVPACRRIRFLCEAETVFKSAGSTPFQENSTGADITVPAHSTIEWTEVAGHWRASVFTAIDHLQPSMDGAVTLKSSRGDLTLQAGAAGNIRVQSVVADQAYLACLGNGSPEGVIIAPVGSDYRDLGGVSGKTFWIKTTGNGSSGWAAII